MENLIWIILFNKISKILVAACKVYANAFFCMSVFSSSIDFRNT